MNIFKVVELQPFLESLVSGVVGPVSTDFSISCVGAILSCFFACLVTVHWKLDVLNIITWQLWRPDSLPRPQHVSPLLVIVVVGFFIFVVIVSDSSERIL